MAPVLCPAVSSKKSLLGLGWSVNTLLTVLSFITAAVITTSIHIHYNKLAGMEQMNYNSGDRDDYDKEYDYDKSGDNENEDREGGGRLLHRYLEDKADEDHHSEDEQKAVNYTLLASVNSTAITFSFFYTALLSLALTLYGSMAVVGFTSIRGSYIEPCFPSEPSDIIDTAKVVTVSPDLLKERSTRKMNLKAGIFMGMLVLFANLCLVTAVVLGEVRVIDNNENYYRNDDRKDNVESEPRYAIENIATVLGVMCMVLAVSHFLYSTLLFSFRSTLISFGHSNNHEHFHSTTHELVSDTIRHRHHQSHIGVVVGDSVIYSPPSLMSSAKYS